MAKEDGGVEHFPAGLRVLVVDDDSACLAILEKMLRRCLYQVTTCCRATIALSLLREKKGAFDLVISDVHMPDMDGFKLLEHVGLEMDLPVIMMSADGTTSAVMRGIKHGACDYLIKPVRIEELKNIWQHVIRKKWSGSKENENSGSMEDAERQKRGIEDVERASSVNDGADSSWKPQKKKRDAKEDDDDDGELENDDSSASKKPRVVWSVELHQQFVNAVNQLGIDKAVPKRILELMNVPGLTRENVASHLQKFRLYLKRLNVVTQQQSGLYNPYSGSSETNANVSALGRGDFQALAASGQIPPQTLAAALHAEYLGCSSGSVVLPLVDQTTLLQTSVPGSKYTPIEQRSIGFGQPLVKCQSNVTKQFTQNNIILENASSGFSDWSPNNFSPACSTANLSGLNNIQSNALGQILPQKQSQPVLSNSSQAVNVQPSCLIAPSQPSNIYHIGSNSNPGNTNTMLLPAQPSNPFQAGVRPEPLMQSSSYGNCNTIANYSHVSSQTNNASLCMGQASNGQFKNAGLLNGSLVPCASGTASSFPSGFALFDANSDWTVSNSVVSNPNSSRLSAANMCDIQNFGGNSILQPDPLQAKHHGFVGKDTSIPSRFAVEDIDCPVGDLTHKRMALGDDAGRVKQEIQLDFLEGSKGGNIGLPHFSSNDFMGVISK